MIAFETLVLRAQSDILPLEQRQDAFAELIQRFQQLILNRATHVLSDPHLAQDMTQETFLAAWCHLDQLRHPHAFPSWLKRILHTQLSRLSRQTHTLSLDTIDVIPESDQRPDLDMETRDLRQKVLNAIACLPDHERIVIELFYLEGCSQRDISRQIDIPVKTVKSRLYTSRKRLQSWLDTLLEDIEKSETQQPITLPTSFIRPEQPINRSAPINQLDCLLETERLKTLFFDNFAILQPDTYIVHQSQTHVLVPVPKLAGAIAPTPTIY